MKKLVLLLGLVCVLGVSCSREDVGTQGTTTGGSSSGTTGGSSSGTTGGSTGSTGCTATANCGCSGINKSPCELAACCRWVVGDGCKCK